MRLSQLFVRGKSKLHTTSERGTFPDSYGSMPWGLAGPKEAVSPDAGSYPSAIYRAAAIAGGG